MKYMFKFFASLYLFAPLIFVPIWAYHNNNWILLFGILISYLGSFITAKGGKTLLIGIIIAIIVAWVSEGFHLATPYFFYLISYLWGSINFLWAESYDQERKKGKLENDGDLIKHVEDNKDEIQQKLAQYLKDHPETNMDYDTIDKIVKGKM